MRRRTIDVIISSTILGMSIMLLLLTPQQVGDLLTQDRVGMVSFRPYVFPLISLLIIALLSVGWLVHTCILKNNIMNENIFSFDKSEVKRVVRAITTLIILILGACAINVIGFIASIAIMTGVVLVYFGVKSWKTISILTVAMPLFIYVFFEVFMEILLPEGIIFSLFTSSR